MQQMASPEGSRLPLGKQADANDINRLGDVPLGGNAGAEGHAVTLAAFAGEPQSRVGVGGLALSFGDYRHGAAAAIPSQWPRGGGNPGP